MRTVINGGNNHRPVREASKETAMQIRMFLSVRCVVAQAVALILACATTAADAQPFPHRAIKIIVPYSAGTGSDVLARTIGQSMSEKSGQIGRAHV